MSRWSSNRAMEGYKKHPAKGPLQICKDNPRYFADSGGKAVYVCGSHTWFNLQDWGYENPPSPSFDYDAHLDFLQSHNDNFIRLWVRALPRCKFGLETDKDMTCYTRPFPWLRSGPGMADDGLPKFDLTRFDPEFFSRVQDRLTRAAARGIFVAIILFEGAEFQLYQVTDDGVPFSKDNNINGIACDKLEWSTLKHPQALAIQEAYVRKMVETVNGFDNVVYEIANETGSYSVEWQYHMIRFIRKCEAKKPKKHLVGMTFTAMDGKNEHVFQSPADWVSPNGSSGYGFPTDPPAADGRKIVVNDSDHSFYWVQLKKEGLDAQRAWVWKNFCRGHNLLFMDPYLVKWDVRNAPKENQPDPYWDVLRQNMGFARAYAQKMDLNSVLPINALSSTNYCLAKATGKKAEYLVYFPNGGTESVDLTRTKGMLNVEWFNPKTGKKKSGRTVSGGGISLMKSPFEQDAVLYLTSR